MGRDPSAELQPLGVRTLGTQGNGSCRVPKSRDKVVAHRGSFFSDPTTTVPGLKSDARGNAGAV